jgi:hypothetical protein
MMIHSSSRTGEGAGSKFDGVDLARILSQAPGGDIFEVGNSTLKCTRQDGQADSRSSESGRLGEIEPAVRCGPFPKMERDWITRGRYLSGGSWCVFGFPLPLHPLISGDILEDASDGTHLTVSVALDPDSLVLDLAPGLTFPARRLRQLEAGSLPTVSSIFPTTFLTLPATLPSAGQK